MLNSAPKNKNYKNGLYVPKNKDKVIKLNNQGGFFYRSSLEQKFMIYLDYNNDIICWNPELIKIPYIKNAWNNKLQENNTTEHSYFPDFYYELKKKDGSVVKVVAEVKPYKDTILPRLSDSPTLSQMRNFEYSMKEYSKNMDKWKFCYEWCKNKGYNFIIIPDKKPCDICKGSSKGCNYCEKGWKKFLK